MNFDSLRNTQHRLHFKIRCQRIRQPTVSQKVSDNGPLEPEEGIEGIRTGLSLVAIGCQALRKADNPTQRGACYCRLSSESPVTGELYSVYPQIPELVGFGRASSRQKSPLSYDTYKCITVHANVSLHLQFALVCAYTKFSPSSRT